MRVSYNSNDDYKLNNPKDKGSNKLITLVAAGAIAVSSYLIGEYLQKNKGHESQVRLPSEIVNAPKNMELIDYAFSDTPTKYVEKITLLPNQNYDTLIHSNNRLVIKGPVNYDIDCKGIEDKTLCNDTRECQLTFKTLDDKLEN